ncbi:MAG TPA: hypothetical protein VFQ61_00210 [Polyangiaceae bacterium]|nr:hypothetical protein [Polyangiaceae bacterium]
MQPNQPVPENPEGQRLDRKPPGKHGSPKLPFEPGGADEQSSKSDFPGQADQRTADDKDGNSEQARHNPANAPNRGR